MAQAPVALDDLDLALMDALRSSPRETNKALGRVLGVSEVTVAARIKRLIDEDVMRVTVQSDISWLGDDLLAYVDVYVARASVISVASAIGELDGVNGVIIGLGSPELLIQLHALDRLQLARDLLPKIQGIPGVRGVVPHIALEVIKFFPEYGSISRR